MASPEEAKDLAVRETVTAPAVFSLTPTTLSEAMEYAKLIATSALCPDAYRGKPGDVLIAIQMGLEVAGCSPLQALQNIAVINGRPSMWGDLVLAVVRNSGKLESIKERDPQECAAQGEGACTVLRRGDAEPITRTFTLAMAETAGLIRRSGSTGPWSTHQGRMLQMRARSWALRDAFPDVLKGLHVREESEDYTVEAVRTVAMPRRLNEPPADVDQFIEESAPTTPKATPKAAPEVRAAQEVQAPPEAQGGASANKWTGCIDNVTLKNGTNKNGEPWTLYTIKGSDGTFFSTFSDTEGEKALDFKGTGEEVTVAFEFSKDGKYKNATAITAELPFE